MPGEQRAEVEAIRTIRKDTESGNKNGAWRGKVESIDDPDRLGRAKVRIWGIHGDEHRTPTNALPWAEVAEHGGGGYDFGPFNPPPVGAAVWLMFEGAHEDFPVIFGTSRGIPKRNDENPNIMLTKDNQPRAEKPWLPPDDENETPKDVFDGVHNGDPHPTRRIWHKSVKGFTIMVEEGDGKEYLKIIDRAGQLIMFDCPVVPEIGEGNKAQRGVRDALRGDQLSHDALVNRRASILFRDLSGQEIILDAKDQNECITLRGRSRDGSSKNTIKIFSGKGKDFIELEDTNGDKLRFDPHGEESLRMEDSTGSFITFNRDKGLICINGSKQTQICTKQEIKNIEGSATSDIGGDEISTVKGNLKKNIINDAAVGVLGNTSGSLGGNLKLIITNAGPSGPEQTPLDIQVVTGNANIKTILGDIILEAIAGDAKLRAALGNATLENGLGPSDKTFLGFEGSSENIICGNIWTGWYDIILNALIAHNHGSAVGPTSPPIIGLVELIAQSVILNAGALNPLNPLSFNVLASKFRV